jgi:hypothetical protein
VFPVSDPQDVHGLLGTEHLDNLVASLRSRADLIVIQSPPVSESAESYLVCSVADRTLLVVGAGSSADSVVAARDQMERVGVSLLGVAFLERPRRRRAKAGSRAVGVQTARSMAPANPGPRPVTTGETSEETKATVNGHAADAWPSGAATQGASSELDGSTPGADPKSRASRN